LSYNSKAIKVDVNAKPIPQYYNPVTDEYEVLQGAGGAARQVLYGPDGQPISTIEGKLAVRAEELETKIEAVRVLLNALAGEDFATQTTLAQILEKMIAAPATAEKQDMITDRVDSVETLLTAIKDTDGIKKITDTVCVDMIDRAARVLGKVSADEDLSAKIEKIQESQRDLYRSLNILIGQSVPSEIYGVHWDKVATPALTRTDAAVDKVANIGVGFAAAANDFDNLPIWGEIEEVTDEYGNAFIRIPKFYIRKMDGEGFKSWQASKKHHPGFYLSRCFWDFANNRELPYFDFGKHLATLGESNRLQSKPELYPLCSKNIVQMRQYAQNNNADSLTGYQQLDIHAVDVLQTLMFIEFATLNMQTVMQGYTTGQYTATHLAVVTETNANRIVVANNHAGLYRVGQSISVGTTQGGNQIFYGRTITSIDDYDADNKAITFDGDPVDITAGNMLYNTAYKTGFSSGIAASSGAIVANDGKYPCAYRGIESPYGDIYQFVDGVNITERQAWVCENADQYASNLFAHPYESLSYRNYADSTEGYVKEMGFDPQHPYAGFPTAVGGSSTTYYSDYHYNSTGERIARFGGYWNSGASAGPSFWLLSYAASHAWLSNGGRLLKKAS
jgi:hypothetical protein